ncbi:CC-NBS-LRR resistance protein, partial [Trifolium medium]|nr:CC-NBS-LRR resistance protein [Trifolium medium]
MKKELPELKVMMISKADELEEIFKSVGDDQKVEIPNLKVVAFVNLPSLCHVQGIQLRAVENCYIHNCKQYSPTSLTLFSTDFNSSIFRIDGIDFDMYRNLVDLFEGMLTSSQGLLSGQFTSQQYLTNQQHQHSLGEIDTTIKLSQGDHGVQVSVEEGTASTSYANTITSSTHLESIGTPRYENSSHFPSITQPVITIKDK